MMLMSWYYVSCFNNIYPYTKYEWIKSSIFVYILNETLSILYIFGFSLIRYISIKYQIEKGFKLINKLN